MIICQSQHWSRWSHSKESLHEEKSYYGKGVEKGSYKSNSFECNYLRHQINTIIIITTISIIFSFCNIVKLVYILEAYFVPLSSLISYLSKTNGNRKAYKINRKVILYNICLHLNDLFCCVTASICYHFGDA